MRDGPRVIIWAERGQEPVLADAIAQAGLQLAAIGASASGTADALAEHFSVPRVDDLRQAILRDDVDLLWLAAPDPIGADERHLIRERGLRAVTIEPRPMVIADLVRDPEEAETATFVPLMRRSAGYRSALDALAEFAYPRCINVAMGCTTGEGTLFARLFDAMDVLNTIAGQAEGVDAALAGPLAAVPQSLDGLHGHMTVNLRFTENCCACVSVSDCAGSWFRMVTVVGSAGCLRITDTGCDWFVAGGEALETGREHAPVHAGQLIGMQIRRLLDGRDAGPDARPPETAKLLALCEAARLSCRTGDGVTPQRVLHTLSKP